MCNIIDIYQNEIYSLFYELGLDDVEDNDEAFTYAVDVVLAACKIINQDQAKGIIDVDALIEIAARKNKTSPTHLKAALSSYLISACHKNLLNVQLKKYLYRNRTPSINKFIVLSTVMVTAKN